MAFVIRLEVPSATQLFGAEALSLLHVPSVMDLSSAELTAFPDAVCIGDDEDCAERKRHDL